MVLPLCSFAHTYSNELQAPSCGLFPEARVSLVLGQPHIYVRSRFHSAVVHHLPVICGPAAQTSYQEAPLWHQGSEKGQEEGSLCVSRVLSLLDALPPGLCWPWLQACPTHPWLLVSPMPSPVWAMSAHASILP
ncbi:rCG38488 [Rattus norvegicus]|uniref:RCG38488 n=1 Tax=Rattus norvegicus TaxID=10116 RepID=A6KLW1_RAT|nr:rCG38488 [Rattus norvegicus]